jgi:hypothetical protein
MRKPGVYKTNGVLKNILYYFKSRKQLKQLSYSRPYLHKKERTNLGGEGETEVIQEVKRIKATLVNLTILFHVTACCLESTRAKN